MDINSLQVNTNIRGGYLCSEQIDLLSIIQCQSFDELIDFIKKCDQINHVKGIFEYINEQDLEVSKQAIFKKYQDTMVKHDEGITASRINRLEYLDVDLKKEWDSIHDKTHPRSQEILSLNHHFLSEERNQLKEVSYEEMEFLNSQLSFFNSLLISSGRIFKVINKYDKDIDTKYDFYFAKRDLDFAYKNGKQVRYHSLLVNEDGKIFDGKDKEAIMDTIREYVIKSIDFIRDYNNNHKIIINGKEEPVINAVDLFNEIVSFEKNEQGEYYNVWEQKYGISMPELLSCFDYALSNKPDGVSYLYNEPFLENDERRHKVLETLSEIDSLKPGLIDTLGSQMHITIKKDIDSIKRCFDDFKELQDTTGKKIQITEFDMSIGEKDIADILSQDTEEKLIEKKKKKRQKIDEISSVINSSGVTLTGVSYWSLTDTLDSNLERIRSNCLNNGLIKNINQIPTVCGGLFSTYKDLLIQKDKTI